LTCLPPSCDVLLPLLEAGSSATVGNVLFAGYIEFQFLSMFWIFANSSLIAASAALPSGLPGTGPWSALSITQNPRPPVG
jgi:hypothetical protein